MQFVSALSTDDNCEQATNEVCESVCSKLDPSKANLALFFTSLHDPEHLEAVAETVGRTFSRAVSLGCTAESTIGPGEEVERRPSVVLMAGSLPDVKLRPFALSQEQFQTPIWAADEFAVSHEEKAVFLAFGDPFTCDVQGFLHLINEEFPGCTLIGGMASAAKSPGGNRLFLNGALYEEGLVGLQLSGNIRIDSVVSQGCRPVGKHFIITEGEGNIINKLGGRPVLSVLQEVVQGLSKKDQRLLRKGLFVGRVIDETKRPLERGDFLIQSVIGIDQEEGYVAVGGPVRKGTTVQFHVRDAECADEDLRQLLSRHGVESGKPPVSGAFLFSCNGRGTRMWPESGHDVGVLEELCGDVPVAGFFCAGELGPVGGKNFIHGFTASIGLIRPLRNDQ